MHMSLGCYSLKNKQNTVRVSYLISFQFVKSRDSVAIASHERTLTSSMDISFQENDKLRSKCWKFIFGDTHNRPFSKARVFTRGSYIYIYHALGFTVSTKC